MSLDHFCTQVYHDGTQISGILVVVFAEVEDRDLHHPDAIKFYVFVLVTGMVDLNDRSFLDYLCDVVNVENEQFEFRGEGHWASEQWWAYLSASSSTVYARKKRP